ncbi:helix-turn-helix domain-containing protein [Kitasatospora phosalacinea]|uniref:helix-turn-helix domain-containing protein n=1 Tax=Kitasatospora phosalacinea TaxID=2065 RepID=UPI0035D70FFC
MSEGEPFGAVLRGLRQRHRLTIEELAEASGVSVRAIGDMERGRSRVPQRRTVAALAEGLGLTAAEGESLLATVRATRPTRATAVAGTAVPPRSVGDFTGRGTELARLHEAAGKARLGAGTSVVVVSGPRDAGRPPWWSRRRRTWPGSSPTAASWSTSTEWTAPSTPARPC